MGHRIVAFFTGVAPGADVSPFAPDQGPSVTSCSLHPAPPDEAGEGSLAIAAGKARAALIGRTGAELELNSTRCSREPTA